MKGSIWTIAGHSAPLLFSFFATPFVIRLLGAEAFGVFILIGLIPSYFNFADFGMGLASTKFGSEAYASGDRVKEARVVRTAAIIALVPSFVIAIVLAVFSGWITSFFSIPAELQGEAILALKIAAGTFVVNFLNAIFNTPQLTRLRMDLNTVISAVPRILGVILTPIVIYFGWGIVGAVAVLFAASVLTLGSNLYFSRRLLPELVGLSIERSCATSAATIWRCSCDCECCVRVFGQRRKADPRTRDFGRNARPLLCRVHARKYGDHLHGRNGPVARTGIFATHQHRQTRSVKSTLFAESTDQYFCRCSPLW